MSYQAMHRVIVDGPEDDRLFRLLIIVADFADRDGSNAKVGQRVLAERTRTSLWGARTLIQRALADRWLVVDKPGDGRWRTVYSLGEKLAGVRNLRGNSRAGCEADAEDRANSREAPSSDLPKRQLARAGTRDEVSRTIARNARRNKSGVARAVEDETSPPCSAAPPLQEMNGHDPQVLAASRALFTAQKAALRGGPA